ncbi:HIT domain-containing protein [Corynebacterium frankenforstense]|uniref:HIT family protein n=1 Tax=Corynebacterium TaxID=1716 RepID=UPI00254BF032|nr:MULTISPECIES: HIT domain-containing protein [Corynebacterium]MDK6260305.1 HIT domain-containing protein [Corynebacterium frankenforstense]MDK8894730.1 HIT domain-containing protein [Corynebacterium sp. MSK006]
MASEADETSRSAHGAGAGDVAGAASSSTYVDRGVGEPDGLVRLWAPYRMNYITTRPDGSSTDDAARAEAAAEADAKEADASAAGKRERDNDPFVDAPRHSDEESLIVARGETVYCILNLYPYNAGHMMVIPYRKVADLEDLTEAESHEMMSFAQEAVRTVKRVSNPDGVNVGFNLGKGSGGSVGSHLHMHIVPRWSGDANFMTVLGGTKVLPQLLSQTRQLLADAWGRTC